MSEKSFLEKIPLVGDIVDIIFGISEEGDDKAKAEARKKAYRETDMRSTSPEVTLTSSGVTSRSTAGSLNLQSTSELRNAGFSQKTLDALNNLIAKNNRSINREIGAVSRRIPLTLRPKSPDKTGFTAVNLPSPIKYKDKDKDTA